MGCTNGRCSRCGIAHDRPRIDARRDEIRNEEGTRRAIREAYFKKKRKTGYPTKGQMRLLNG